MKIEKKIVLEANGKITACVQLPFRNLSQIALVLPYFAVIGPENSRHSLNQSDAKLKPTTTWSPAFSRALGRVVVFTLSSHWLLKVFSSLLIGCCNYFSFRFTSVNRTTLHNAKERDTHAILVYFRKLFQNYFSSMRTL